MLRLLTFSPALLLGINAYLLLCLPTQVYGHGYLKTPRSRNFVAYEDGKYWPKLEEDPAIEDCPHCLNLGGVLSQCGITGDRNYDFPKNGLGGPMHVNIQSTYAEESIITLDVVLSAHHRGHFTFNACPYDPNSPLAPTPECFDDYPLEFVSDELYSAPKDPNYPGRAYIAPSGWPGHIMDNTGVSGMLFSYKFKLPAGLRGDHILLQWHYLTANSCAHDGYKDYDWPDPSWKPTNLGLCIIPPDGRGVPEQFWNCAEISIIPSSPTNPPTLSPPIAPTTAQPSVAPTEPTTAAPVPPPTPTPPPVIGTCGGGQVGNGVCSDPNNCCSEWGWCGTSPEHCAAPPPTPPPPPTAPTPPTPPVSGEHGDSRLIAYLGNWQACPTAEQVEKYTHIVIAFAVSYTWSSAKNICSETCEIAEPPICNNAANPGLVSEWQAAGKKIILSFGGAGMGGSWPGDNNDCWEYCFGREDQVVNRLTQLVDSMGLDGIDLDYEYFYEGRPDAIEFLRKVTVGMRDSLPPDAIVTHAPMEPDIAQGTAYFDLFVELASHIDFVMPQYYNGYTRPATDGFDGGAVSAEAHYTAIVNQIFDGDATKIIFGFCITGCIGSASGEQAAEVMTQVNNYYDCNGGAYFWVAYDDVGGAWSRTVSAAVAPNAGCSGPPTTPAPIAPTPPTTLVPTSAPVTPSPTSSPVTQAPQDPWTMCCPSGFTGLKAYGDCMSYYHCVGGIVTGGLLACSPGTLFSETAQVCDWASTTTCTITLPCGGVPTIPPSTQPTPIPTPPPSSPPTSMPVSQAPVSQAPVVSPTPLPTAAPVVPATPVPTIAPVVPATPVPTSAPVVPATPVPTLAPVVPPTPLPTVLPVTPAPVSAPTPEVMCCPEGFSGLRAYDSCTKFFHCQNGALYGAGGSLTSCAAGTLFSNDGQNCFHAWQVTECVPDSCPSIAPTPSPPANEEMCCPTGFTGLRPFDSCKKYYHCVGGSVTGSPLPCGAGTLWDVNNNYCNWATSVQCDYEYCPSTTQ